MHTMTESARTLTLCSFTSIKCLAPRSTMGGNLECRSPTRLLGRRTHNSKLLLQCANSGDKSPLNASLTTFNHFDKVKIGSPNFTAGHQGITVAEAYSTPSLGALKPQQFWSCFTRFRSSHHTSGVCTSGSFFRPLQALKQALVVVLSRGIAVGITHLESALARNVCRYVAGVAVDTSGSRHHRVSVDGLTGQAIKLEHRGTKQRSMANTSGCSLQFNSLELSDASCGMGGSDEWDYVTALASEADLATTASSVVSAPGESMMEGGKSRNGSPGARSVEEQIEQSQAHGSVRAESDCKGGEEVATSLPYLSAVEEQIETSKAHWSELAESVSMEGEEVAEVSNVEEFKALQSHPTWGGFFQTFGYDLGVWERMGELVMGEKFAEGGQAELYDAQVQWWYPEANEETVKEGREFVLKVFKKGTFLKDLKSQLPQGLLQVHIEDMEQLESGTWKEPPRLYCHVHCGTLLKDGRFAFLMEKEHADLRNYIERNMKLRRGQDGGPFSKEEAEAIIYNVALGLEWLHSYDIVHRDLKASNVLVTEFEGYYPECCVADYECSIGVVGTGFFRAPEILQVCKDRNLRERQEVFSKAADIYSYGMVCYEVLTGKLPFQDHPLNDNCGIRLLMDLVINHDLRPEVPEYVEDWAHELLTMCWQSNPSARPRIDEILGIISRNSATVRDFEKFLVQHFGRSYRSNLNDDAEISN